MRTVSFAMLPAISRYEVMKLKGRSCRSGGCHLDLQSENGHGLEDTDKREFGVLPRT